MSRTPWFVSVNRQTIDRNRRTGSDDPPIVFRYGRSGPSNQAHEVELPAGSVMSYEPQSPLPCGARLFVRCPSEPRRVR
jgi:hypothetical protein